MAYTNWQIIKISELEDGAYTEGQRLFLAVDDGNGIKKLDSSLIRVKFTEGGVLIDDKFNELDAKIGAIGSFELASIDAETGEPDVDEPSTKVIYLTRDEDSGKTDPYTEWIYIEGSGWSIIGETSIDLSNYMQKVAEATAGNFASLTAAGEVSDSGLNSTNFATAAQGTKADTAVQPGDLATVATTGSYNDLSDTPHIPPDPVPQVQANWTEDDTTLPSYIQNKPVIPAAQVNSDWNSNSGVSEILNKPHIPVIETVEIS